MKGRGWGSPYLAARFLPWTAAAALLLWPRARRAFLSPPLERAPLLRFAGAWVLGGLALFTAGAAKRPDHLMPLDPAAAILAGIGLEWALRERNQLRTIFAAAAVAAAAGLPLLPPGRERARDLSESAAAAAFAAAVRRAAGDAPIVFAGVRYAVEFYLGRQEPILSGAEAARALSLSPAPFVATRGAENRADIERCLGRSLRVVASAPASAAPGDHHLLLAR